MKRSTVLKSRLKWLKTSAATSCGGGRKLSLNRNTKSLLKWSHSYIYASAPSEDPGPIAVSKEVKEQPEELCTSFLIGLPRLTFLLISFIPSKLLQQLIKRKQRLDTSLCPWDHPWPLVCHLHLLQKSLKCFWVTEKHLMVTEGFAPIMLCSPQTELCKDIETPSVTGNKHNYAKVGRRGRRGMVPCTSLFSYPSGIRKARLERKSQQLWISQPNSSAMTQSLYAHARERE